MSGQRALVGLSASAIVAPAMLGLASAMMLFDKGQNFFAQLGSWMMVSMIVGVPIALFHVFVIAMPFYDRLSARWPLRWWRAALGGLLVATLPVSVLAIVLVAIQAASVGISLEFLLSVGWYLAWIGSAGVTGGLVFWLFARGDPA